MKHAIAKLVPRYNTVRMVREYSKRFYVPAIRLTHIQQRLGNSEPERPCRAAIDHQLEARGLLDRQRLRIGPIENAVDEGRGARKTLRKVRSGYRVFRRLRPIIAIARTKCTRRNGKTRRRIDGCAQVGLNMDGLLEDGIGQFLLPARQVQMGAARRFPAHDRGFSQA